MTLGGLALAVGILVDDATVEIENVHRQMAMASRSSRRSSTAPRKSRCRPCQHALHLHRFRADVFPGRRRAFLIRAPRRSGGVCHAGQLPPFADAHSHARDVVLPQFPYHSHEHEEDDADEPPPRAGRRPSCISSGYSSMGSRIFAMAIARCSKRRSRTAGICRDLSRPVPWFAFARPQLARISSRKPMAASSDCTSAPAAAPASRRRCDSSNKSSRRSAKSFPSMSRRNSRQYRHPLLGHRPELQQQRRHRHRRRDILVSLNHDHRPTKEYVRDLRLQLNGNIPASCSTSSPRISSARRSISACRSL